MEDTYNLHVSEDEEQYPELQELKQEQWVHSVQEDPFSLEQKQLVEQEQKQFVLAEQRQFVQEEQYVVPQTNPYSIRTQTIGPSFD